MNKLSILWEKLPSIIKNKYLLALILFAVWIIFFDHNNLINQWQTDKELNSLLQKRNFYNNGIKEINQTKDAMFSNADKLERFARERYLMKKNNEDLFIIERDTVHN